MNIEDIKNVVECPGPVIPTIFQLQESLMYKYEPIEANNGINIPKLPGHLDNRQIQYRIKDMFWRFTEELCEAAEELILNPAAFDGLVNWQVVWDNESSIRHFFEEIVDALHFLTEASIISQLNPYYIESSMICIVDDSNLNGTIKINLEGDPQTLLKMMDALFFKIIRSVGLAANCLKNKPWKVSEMATDISGFNSHLYQAWCEFLTMWNYLGGNSQILYILYAKKNLVNQWRQKTQY